jgi:hypothetical protein
MATIATITTTCPEFGCMRYMLASLSRSTSGSHCRSHVSEQVVDVIVDACYMRTRAMLLQGDRPAHLHQLTAEAGSAAGICVLLNIRANRVGVRQARPP